MRPIVEVRNISKQYSIGARQAKNDTFREYLQKTTRQVFRRIRNPSSRSYTDDIFWALRDVTFDAAEGEVLGIMGPNGAGKSTLLKILARVTDPTEGHVHVRGRMASLLEVGTGFHPELTGRENVFLNGAILGMRRSEIISKFDEIVAFSEIEQFLDTPVKRYSSGMYVRLAFAVAAHLNPEILLVDEVLAVGDVAFQNKCLGKMGEVRRSGRTVLFVSHNMAMIENLCQSGVVLDHGGVAFSGKAEEAVKFYIGRVASTANRADGNTVDLRMTPNRVRGSRPLLKKIEFFTEGDQPLIGPLPLGAPLRIRVHFALENLTDSFDIGIGFISTKGVRVFTAHSGFEPNRSHGLRTGLQVFMCDIPSLTLMPGDYVLRLWLDVNNADADLIEEAAGLTIAPSDFYGSGKAPWNGFVVLKHRWFLEQTVGIGSQ